MRNSSQVSKTRGREGESKSGTEHRTRKGNSDHLSPAGSHGLPHSAPLAFCSTAIKAISVKSALKKATQPDAASGAPRVPKTPAQLAAIEQSAGNPAWLLEISEYMAKHPDQPCRYTTIEDLLHPNSISRFHFLIKVGRRNTRRGVDCGWILGRLWLTALACLLACVSA